MGDECEECQDVYTNKHRKKIICSECKTECCKRCIQEYIKEEREIKCRYCHTSWDDDFIREISFAQSILKFKKEKSPDIEDFEPEPEPSPDIEDSEPEPEPSPNIEDFEPEPEPEPQPEQCKPGPKKNGGIKRHENITFTVSDFKDKIEDILLLSDEDNCLVFKKCKKNHDIFMSFIENSKFNKDFLFSGGIVEKVLYNRETDEIVYTGNITEKKSPPVIEETVTGISGDSIKEEIKMIPVKSALKPEIIKSLEDNGIEYDKKKIKLVKDLKELCQENGIEEVVKIPKKTKEEVKPVNYYELEFIDDKIKDGLISLIKQKGLIIEDYFRNSSDDEEEGVDKEENTLTNTTYILDPSNKEQMTVYHELTHELIDKTSADMIVYSSIIGDNDRHIYMGQLIRVSVSSLMSIYGEEPPLKNKSIESNFLISQNIEYQGTNYSICVITGFSIKEEDLMDFEDNQITERLYLVKKTRKIPNYVTVSKVGLDFKNKEDGHTFSYFIGSIKDEETIIDVYTKDEYVKDKIRYNQQSYKLK